MKKIFIASLIMLSGCDYKEIEMGNINNREIIVIDSVGDVHSSNAKIMSAPKLC